jgi:hypothetical protein
LDILGRCGVIEESAMIKGKGCLVRVVSMLTRMIDHYSRISEEGSVYGNENEYGYGEEAGRSAIEDGS